RRSEAPRFSRRTIERLHQAVLAAACSGRLTADWRERQVLDDSATDSLQHFLRQRRHHPRGRRAEPFEPEELPDLPATWAWSDLDSLARDEPNALKAGPFGSSLTKAMYAS